MKDNILYWNLDETIFWITDTFPLKYYGLFFVTGLLCAYYIIKRIYKKEGENLADLDKLTMYIFIGTVAGARLGHCLFYEPTYYLSNPLEMLLPIQQVNGSYRFVGYSGLASHGGTIGVFIAILIFCKKTQTKLFWILDRIAIVSPISAAFIRLGNFMNSEIYGKPTNGNWGVVFQKDDLIPRHPTQLYEAGTYLIIALILLFTYKRLKTSNGFLFGQFLSLFFSARLLIEFFKENQVQFEDQLSLNMGQYLSIPFIITGIIIIILKRK